MIRDALCLCGFDVSYHRAPDVETFNAVCDDPTLVAHRETCFPDHALDRRPGATQTTADTLYNDKYAAMDGAADQSEHVVLLKMVRRCLDRCQVQLPVDRRRVGIFHGSLSFPDKVPLPRGQRDESPAVFVARSIGATGPAFSMDAACATSLYTMSVAQLYLAAGDIDVAICSACTLPDPLFVLSGFSVFGALSRETCTPLSADADGLVPGEGCAVFVLRRADECRDGCRALGMHMRTTVGNAGRGLPLKPDLESQVHCVRAAYTHPEETVPDYIECHATGTRAGDTAEVETYQQVFGNRVPPLRSTKGIFGHSLVSAGFAGIARAIHSLQTMRVPPTPLGLQSSGASGTARSSTEDAMTRGVVGVSAFGFGGTNAHTVVFRTDAVNGTALTAGRVVMPSLAGPSPSRAARSGAVLECDIVGMSGHVGDCDTVEDIRTRLRENRPLGILRRVTVDSRQIRAPRLEKDWWIPSHYCGVHVLDEAVRSVPGTGLDEATAVVVGLGADPVLHRHRERIEVAPSERASREGSGDIVKASSSTGYQGSIGNLVATRVASLHGFRGPAFTVDTRGPETFRACLDVARRLLASSSMSVTAVVVGCVDTDGGLALVLRRAVDGSDCVGRLSDLAGHPGDDVVLRDPCRRVAGALSMCRPILAHSNAPMTLLPFAGVRDGTGRPTVHYFVGDTLVAMLRALRSGQPVASGVDCVRTDVPRRPYRCAIYGDVPLSSETLQRVERALGRSDRAGSPWYGPGGLFVPPSCIPAAPVKVALVYGDVLSSSRGTMARGLCTLFPRLESYASRATGMTREDLARLDGVPAMLVQSTYYAFVQTQFLRQVLGLVPDGSIGVSMGEVAAVLSNDASSATQARDMCQAVCSHPVWTASLGGDCRVVREAWDIAPGVPVGEFWCSYAVVVPCDVAAAQIRAQSRVFLALVLTGTTCVVCGHPSDCASLFSQHGWHYRVLETPGLVAHCPLVPREVSDQVAELFSLDEWCPAVPVHGCDLGEDRGAGERSPSTRVARMYRAQVSFPDQFAAARANGYNVFVEAGTSGSYTAAIRSMCPSALCLPVDGTGHETDDLAAWERVLSIRALQCLLGLPPSGVCRKFRLTVPVARPPQKGDVCCEKKQPPSTRVECVSDMSTGKVSTPLDSSVPSERVVWDYDALLEFAEGRISTVFGADFLEIDAYRRRVRLPMRDYLLVTRVTKVDAVVSRDPREFRPSTMTTEFDLPVNAWFSGGGDVPWCILVESGQCDLLLISYMGVDFMCRGERVYRLLDTTLIFHGIAREGDTLRYDISIDSFAMQGEQLLFFFSYNCYVGEELIIEMRGGCAGFFTDDELASGKGATARVYRDAGKREHPFAARVEHCKRALSTSDMQMLCDRRWHEVLGDRYDGVDDFYATRRILMIDEVLQLDPTGGPYGIGRIVGAKHLSPTDWYFPCHFKDDEVLAGSLVCEGCSQLIRLYGMMLGLVGHSFVPAPGEAQKVRCRGQISPHHGRLIYVMDIIRLEVLSSGRTAISANVAILDIDHAVHRTFSLEDIDLYGRGDMTRRIVVDFQNVAIHAVPPPTSGAATGQRTVRPRRGHAAGQSWRGNGLEPLARNREEGVITFEQLCEHSYGDIGKCLPTLAHLDNHVTFRMPASELQLVHRVLSIDSNSIVTEVDLRTAAWCGNSVVPLSVWMEILLQPCGFLSSHGGAHTSSSDRQFRNLDGHIRNGATALPICLDGTVVRVSVAKTSDHTMNGNTVQQFSVRVSVRSPGLEAMEDHAVTLDTKFGWFAVEQMLRFRGLDKGKCTLPYSPSQQPFPCDSWSPLELGADSRRPKQLHLLDRAWVVSDTVSLGTMAVDPDAWFFSCHFWRDPVMPGSLGVEAMLELANARYGPSLAASTDMTWSYRGQVSREAREVAVVLREDPATRILSCDLYVDEMRIYHVARLGAVSPAGDVVPVGPVVVGMPSAESAGTHPWSHDDPALQTVAVTSPHFDQPRPVCLLPFDAARDADRDRDHVPGRAPFTWYNIHEFTVGRVSRCFGPDFEEFDTMRVSRMPNAELQLVSRVLRVTGTRYHIRGGETIDAEFDLRDDAWFLPDIPFSILMEIALQPCGFLTAYLGSASLIDADSRLFRNLDADMTLHVSGAQLRALVGRTWSTHCTLTSSNKLGNMVIQTFEVSLSCQGVVLFGGKTSFGWFSAHDMVVQPGLDGGKLVPCAYVASGAGALESVAPIRTGKMSLLDTIQIDRSRKYMHGTKATDPSAWFFACHFWLDPVMPGSLGVEACFELLEAYAKTTGDHHRAVEYDAGRVKWKYRGQLSRESESMAIDLHVQTDSVRPSDGARVLVASASLWVDGVRKYSVSGMRMVCGSQELGKDTTTSGSPGAAVVPVPPPEGPARTAPAVDRPALCPSVPSHTFCQAYGVRLPMYAGAMAKGIASVDLVVAMGNAGLLASLGAGGLPVDAVRRYVEDIQTKLRPGATYAVNLIHSPFNSALEMDVAALLIEKDVRVVEASAFMALTPAIVRYRAAGMDAHGRVLRHRVLAKVSRTEVAEHFLKPPPREMLDALVAKKHITAEQAEMAAQYPMCDDLVVESDSGGHTDNRPMHVLVPIMRRLRDDLAPSVRLGAGGGIGCPDAVRAALSLGADFVVTGSINQMAREAGTCDYVRACLRKATYSDVVMAPAADMFDQGVELQVLSRGTMFPQRAKKLYRLYRDYSGLDAIPAPLRAELETRVFGQSIESVWEETKQYYECRLRDPDKVRRAMERPKLRMSMVFRWYLSKSSRWANDGVDARKKDYQIWCGPAIGSFNVHLQGTDLDPLVSGVYPSVVDITDTVVGQGVKKFHAAARGVCTG